MNLRNISAVLILLSSSLATDVAVAEAPAPPTRVVSYADLNLATAAGQRVLERRLAAAARSVCGPVEGRDLRLQSGWRDCVARALADARAALPAAQLAAQAPTPAGAAATNAATAANAGAR